MTSRLRFKTQQQADREIRREQSGFLTGMNLDLPRSEINETQVADSYNLIPFRTHVESRPGTEYIGDLPGAGVVHNLFFHDTSGKYILHRAERLYVSTDLVNWTETKNVTDLADAESTIKTLGDDAVIFQESKICLVELDNPDLVLRRFNGSNPVGPLNVVNATQPNSTGPYVYNYVYTYYREVDGVIVAESGVATTEVGGQVPAVSTVYADTPIEQCTVQINGFAPPTDGDSNQNNVGAGVGNMQVGVNFIVSTANPSFSPTTQWTGIRVYRTANYGDDGIGAPYSFNLVGTYTFDDVSPWRSGIGSMRIGSTFVVGANPNNNISMPDSLWVNQNILSVYGYTPLPNGVVGEITNAFIFSASQDDSTFYYSEYGSNPLYAGYHFVGAQFQRVDGSIRAMVRSPDSIAIICRNSTYRASTINTQVGQTDVIGFNTIYPATLIDENVGVTDVGSIAYMDRSRFMAVCSDYTVRVWDGINWGYDRAKQLVSTEIQKAVNGSVAIYHPSGYYILWYRDDISESYPNKTLRLGLVEDVGVGWCRYSGDDWLVPPNRQGIVRGIDSSSGLMMIVAVDQEKEAVYQIETFDGPSGSRFVRRDVDGFGRENGDIECQLDFAELTGSSESFWVLHENTNFFLRPFERNESYPNNLILTVNSYVDDSSSISASYYTSDLDSDISFDKNIQGKRIRMSIISNKAGFKLVGTETVYRVQDRPTRSYDNKIADYQSELASGLALWSTRINPLENIRKLPGDVQRDATVVGVVDLQNDQLQSGNYSLYFNGSST